MHGTSLSTLLVAVTFGLVPPSTTTAGTADVVAEARRTLARDDGIAASKMLEDALPEAGAAKETVIALLQKSYEVAANQAQKAGRVKEAETYRENLKILNRKSRTARATPAASAPLAPPVEPTPARSNVPEPTPPIPDPSAAPSLLPESPSPATPSSSNLDPSPTNSVEVPPVEAGPPKGEPSNPSPLAEPTRPSPRPAADLSAELAAGDAAFESKNYREAGRIYGALAKEKRLPDERRKHWLYCRASEVLARINAHPQSATEWANINEELKQMRALSPDFYPTEYLRDLAAERQNGRKKTNPSNKLVVRGSAPEEPAPVDRPVRPTSNPTSPEASRPSPSLTSSNPGAARIGTAFGRWQVLDSKNFRIYHADPALAAKVAKAAETARSEVSKRWSNQPPRGPWTPQCEIYLYPTAGQYAQMTGQPEDSPGFSTMGMNEGKIISRRVNLRADHPTLVSAVLPHEVTHVILADHFTDQQIPRWADEGLAVLSEPEDEQQRRASDLVNPLAANRLFTVDALMNMDYPDNRYWSLYYAQSVSLSRYLVEQGTPAQMIQFIKTAQREGYEVGLRRVYKIDGFADLQRKWLDYARTRTVPQTASSPTTEPDLKVR